MGKKDSSTAYVFLAGDCPKIWSNDLPQEDDLIVAVDGGYMHAKANGLQPDLLLGDFDSIAAEDLAEAEEHKALLIRWPTAKDFSDAELAFAELSKRKIYKYRIFGALGGDRLDHMLANLNLLLTLHQQKCKVDIFSGHVHAEFLSNETKVFNGSPGDQISLIPYSLVVKDVSFTNVLYPLHSEELFLGKARSISNEFLGKEAYLTLSDGVLLAIHYRK